MKFRYKTKTADGRTIQAIEESPDKNSLRRTVEQRNETLIWAEPAASAGATGILFRFFPLGRVGASQKIIFARNLGLMIEAGLPLGRALSVLERQTKNRRLKKSIGVVQNEVGRGQTLSAALDKFPEIFPPLFISMVRAGEESGSLSQALKSIADQLERVYLLVRRLRGALIYPVVVLSAMLIISVLMLVFLVPTLTQTFEELSLQLPLSTRIIIALSGFLKNQPVLSLAGGLFFILLIYGLLKVPPIRKAAGFFWLNFPIVGSLIKESNAARTARTLAALLSSGVEFLAAMEITKEVVQNRFYRQVLEQAAAAVKRGEPVSGVFQKAERLYPIFVGEMMSIGEETGKLPAMLFQVADFYEESINQKTKNMSSVIEPLLIIFIGLFVGIFAVSMLGPIYSLVGAI